MQTGTTQEEEVNKDNEQCKANGKDAIDIQSSKLQTDVTTAVASVRPPSSTPIPRCPPTPSSRPATPWRRSVKTPAGCPRPWPSRRAIPEPPKPCRRAIQKLMDDGTYKKILDTWGVGSGAIDKAEINPADAA